MNRRPCQSFLAQSRPRSRPVVRERAKYLKMSFSFSHDPFCRVRFMPQFCARSAFPAGADRAQSIAQFKSPVHKGNARRNHAARHQRNGRKRRAGAAGADRRRGLRQKGENLSAYLRRIALAQPGETKARYFARINDYLTLLAQCAEATKNGRVLPTLRDSSDTNKAQWERTVRALSLLPASVSKTQEVWRQSTGQCTISNQFRARSGHCSNLTRSWNRPRRSVIAASDGLRDARP